MATAFGLLKGSILPQPNNISSGYKSYMESHTASMDNVGRDFREMFWDNSWR